MTTPTMSEERTSDRSTSALPPMIATLRVRHENAAKREAGNT
jgi:hypothetical protein